MNKVDPKKIRIIYLGTPEISATVLSYLLENNYNVVALICKEDKPVGRKHLITPCPTKVVANKYGVPVYQPHKIREDYKFIFDLKPDLILTFAYGQIIPEEILNIPTYRALNIHGSLLPKLRGASPISRAILNGESVTGVSLMEMVKEMDAGKVYSQISFKIEEDDNFTSVSKKIAEAGIKIIERDLELYLNNKLEGIVQDESQVTFANKIKSEDEKLDLNKSLIDFIRQVNSLSESPGGYLYLNNEKFKIYKVEKTNLKSNGIVGSLIIDKSNLYLNLSDGVARLLIVQSEGKKIMHADAYILGHKNINNQILK